MDAIPLGMAALYSTFLVVGLGIAWFAFGRGWAATLILAPILGMMATALPAYILVSLDHPVREWAWSWVFLAATVSLVLARLAPRGAERPGTSRFLVILIAAAFALQMAPVFVGGLDFLLLRGNATDHSNYVAYANYLEEEPYAWAQSASPDELGQKDATYRFTARFGTARWLTKSILAFGCSITGIPAYLLFHSVTLVCLLWAGLLLAYLLREAGVPDWLCLGAGVSVAAGFWAQVLLDIQAFAHINSVPQMALFVFLLAQAPQSAAAAVRWARTGLVTLLGFSLTLHYPELIPVLMLGFGVWGLRAYLDRQESWTRTVCLGGALSVGIVLALWMQPSIVTYGLGQGRVVAEVDNSAWHRALFPFLFREPPLGIAGLTPLAGYASWGEGPFWIAVKFLVRTIAIAGCVGLAASLANWHFRWVKHPALDVLQSLSLGCLGAAIAFLLLRQRWAAAKAFSFGSPLYLSSFVLFAWMLHRQSPGFRLSWLRPAQLVGLACVLLAGQAVVAGCRVLLAGSDRDFPNYVWHIPAYRGHQDWDVRPFRAHLSRSDTVGVALAEPWEQEVLWNILRRSCKLVALSPVPDCYRNGKLPAHGPVSPPRLLLMDRGLAEAQRWNIVAANRSYALVRANDEVPRLIWWRRDWFAAPAKNVAELAIWSGRDGAYTVGEAHLPRDGAGRFLSVRQAGNQTGEPTSVHASQEALAVRVKAGINFVRISLESADPSTQARR